MKLSAFLSSVLLVLLSTISYAQEEEKIPYPKAHKVDVIDDYHGMRVEDPYRWLENDTLSATKKWIYEENELTAKYLRGALFRYPIEDQLKRNSYYSFGTTNRSGKFFFESVRRNSTSSACLYMKKKIRDNINLEDPVVDPADYKSRRNEGVTLAGYEVSRDNKYLAFSLSRNGSDWRDIHVKTLSPLKDCKDVITGVKFSGIEWRGNGFYYCRYTNLEKDKPLTSLLVNPCLYYHKLGTVQDEDSLIFEYTGQTVLGTIDFEVVENERFLIVYHASSITSKKSGQISFWDFSDPQQKAFKTLLTHPVEKENFFNVVGFLNGKFIVHSDLDSPYRQILSFDPSKPNKASQLIPSYTDAILGSVRLIDRKLVCLYLKDIDNVCVTFDSTGNVLKRLSYPSGSSVAGFRGTNQDTTTLFYYHSFLHPPIAYEYNLRSLKVTLTEQTEIGYDLDDFEMTKVFYRSKDSTLIPMIIAGKKGLKRKSDTPTILYGYGGYGTAFTPFFDVGFITHIRNGGLVALPCIRGGGEYGEEWHSKGTRENKQNVFDDFIAAAEYLIEKKYTCSNRLALMGGSNGGLLVGAVLTQRPELFKVAICDVGVYDMLRYHNFTIGYGWRSEYGTSNDSVAFKYLYEYSPLHSVKAGVKYPATLITTGDHDDRVVPLHSYKFAATLQERNAGTNPILLYTIHNAGHDGESATGKSEAYKYAFIYKNMGLKTRDLSFMP